MDYDDAFESNEREPFIKKVVPTEDLDHNDGDLKRGDEWNISLLLFLYLLQGIPLGLTEALPIILQSRHNISYSDQAEFSFSSWPFSLKLLWAPLVDTMYSAKFGKRKSWLIPSQILLGSVMLLISANIENWLGDENCNHPPNVQVLTIMFFLANFLTATQDIAVDGWAVTMFQQKNRGYVAICTCIGQAVGKFFGGSVFIMLASVEFTDRYLFWLKTVPSRSTGIVSFSAFMFFWAVVILVSTIVVGIFKTENTKDHFESKRSYLDSLSALHSYKLVWKILNLKPIQYTISILLTVQVPTIATGEVFTLKLVDNGVPRDKIAALAVFSLPLSILLPIAFRRKVIESRPMEVFKTILPYSLVIGLVAAALVYTTSLFREDTELPFYYYGLLIILNGLAQTLFVYMFLGCLAFMAKVSDPQCGATYMALLATVVNLGSLWPSTASLWLVDVLTWEKCVVECKNHILEPCEEMKTCSTFVDGFYVEVILCTIIGIIWLYFGRRTIDYLQELDQSAWLIDKSAYQTFTGEERSQDYDELQRSVVEPNERRY